MNEDVEIPKIFSNMNDEDFSKLLRLISLISQFLKRELDNYTYNNVKIRVTKELTINYKNYLKLHKDIINKYENNKAQRKNQIIQKIINPILFKTSEIIIDVN